MALLNLEPGRSVFSVLSGLDDSPEVQEAYLRYQREQTITQQKEAYLAEVTAQKRAKFGETDFGYDINKSVQENLGEAFANHQVQTDPVSGQHYILKNINGSMTKVPYNGATRDLYIGQGQAGDIKIGLARNDVKTGYESYQARYMDKRNVNPYTGAAEAYDGTPGPFGVNPTKDKPLVKVTLPYDYATQLEYGIHTDIDMIKSRAMGPNTPQSASHFYGPGQNEYYLANNPLTNDRFVGKDLPYVTKDAYMMELGQPRFNKPFEQPTYNTHIDNQSTLEKLSSAFGAGGLSLGAKMAQGVNGFGSYIINNLVENNTKEKYGTPDWLVSTLKSGRDFFRENEEWYDQKQEDGSINKLVDYRPEQVQKYGEAFKDSVKKREYYTAVKGLLSDPESAAIAFANSLPEMAAMATGWGFGAVMASNVNKDLYNLEENAKAKGVELTTTDKATAMGLSVVSTVIDRLGDKAMLGKVTIPGVLNPATQQLTKMLSSTLNAMTPTVRNAVLKRAGGTLADLGITTSKLAGKAAAEGVTEGIQEIMQGKATDIDNLHNLTDLNQKEIDNALVATGIGMGAGGIGSIATSLPAIKDTTLNVGGTVVDLTNAGFNKLAKFGYNRTDAGKAEAQAKETAKQDIRTNAQDLYNQSKIIDENTNIYDIYHNNVQAYIDAIDLDENSHKFNNKVNENIIHKLATEELNEANIKNDKGNTQSATDMIEDLYVQAKPENRNNPIFINNLSKIANAYNIDEQTFNDITDSIKQAEEQGMIDSHYGSNSYKKYGRLLRQAQHQGNTNSVNKIQNILNREYTKQSGQLEDIQRVEDAIEVIKANNTQISNALESLKQSYDPSNTDPNYIKQHHTAVKQATKQIKKIPSSIKVKSIRDRYGKPYTIQIDSSGKLDNNTLAMKEKLYNSIETISNELNKAGVKPNNNNNNTYSTDNSADINTYSTTDTHTDTTPPDTRTDTIDTSIKANTDTVKVVKTKTKTKTDNGSGSTTNTDKDSKTTNPTDYEGVSEVLKTKINQYNSLNDSFQEKLQKNELTPKQAKKILKRLEKFKQNIDTSYNNTEHSKNTKNKQESKNNTNKRITNNKNIGEDTTETKIDIDVAHMAGFDKLKSTIQEKVKNIGMKLDNLAESVRFGHASDAKQKLFKDTINMKDHELITAVINKDIEEVKSIFTEASNSTSENTTHKGIRFIKKFLGSKESTGEENIKALQKIVKKVSEGLKENDKALEALNILYSNPLADTNNVTGSKAVKAVMNAIATIHDTVKSTADIRHNLGVTRQQNERVYAPKNEVAIQLGKVFLNQSNLRFAGTSENTTIAYYEVGNLILDIALASGLVKEESVEQYIPNRLVTQDNKHVTTKLINKYFQASVDDEHTLSFMIDPSQPTNHFKIAEVKSLYVVNSSTNPEDVSPIETVSNTFQDIFQNANLELPTDEAVETVHSNYEIPKGIEQTIQKLQTLPLKFRPEALRFIGLVKQIIDRYSDFDTALSKSKLLPRLLKIHKSGIELREETEKGQTIGKTSKLINLTENLDNLTVINEKDGLFFNFDVAINQRMHTKQTVLDFQGDKYMARQLLSGGEITVKSELAKRLLINNVASELKATPKDIADITGYKVIFNDDKSDNSKNKLTAEQINSLKNGIKTVERLLDGQDTTFAISNVINITETLGIKTPFKTLSLLGVLNDISKSTDGHITTSYPVEVDAVSSGLINTILNLAGFEGMQGLLKGMGIGVLNGKEIDPYTYTTTLMEEHFEAYRKIKPVRDPLVNIGIDNRELAKYAIIKWIYGQANENNNHEMGKSIVEGLLDKAFYDESQQAVDLVNEILELKPTDNNYYRITAVNNGKPINKITDEHVLALEKYYEENLAPIYTDALDDIFAPITRYREQLGEIYDLLTQSNVWDGKITTPFDAVNKEAKTTKASLDKLKQYVFQYVSENKNDDESNEPLALISSKAFNNKGSFKVNLQHMTDATVLYMTLKDVLNDKQLDDITNGIMTVHDAIYVNPELALNVIERYNYYVKKVALEYDFLQAAINELKEVAKKLEDTNPINKKSLIKIIKNKINELEKVNNKAIETKRKVLNDIELNVVGDYEVGNVLAAEKHNKNSNNLHKVEYKFSYKFGLYENNTQTASNQNVKQNNVINDNKDNGNDIINEANNDNVVTDDKQTTEKDNEYYGEKTDKNLPETTKYEDEINELQDINTVLEELHRLSKSSEETKVDNIITLLNSLNVSDTHTDIREKVKQTIIHKTVKFINGKQWAGGNQIVTIPDSKKHRNIKTVDKLVEVLGHEVDHAVQYKYIRDNLNKSNELKYLSRVIERLVNNRNQLSHLAKKRLSYILNPEKSLKGDELKARQITELSSVIMNEPDVAKEILFLLNNKDMINKVIDFIKEIKQRVVDYFKTLSDEEIDNLAVSSEKLVEALTVLDTNARASLMDDIAKEISGNTDSVKFANFDNSNTVFKPLNIVNDTVTVANQFSSDWLRFFGTEVSNTINPVLVKTHTKLKQAFPLYVDVVNLLKTGFYDSEFAQKMHYILGISGDVTDKVIETSLTMFNSYQQELSKTLDFMAQLDRQLKSIYNKEDQIVIHRLFADTGIANLSKVISMKNELFNKTKTVTELIEELKTKIKPYKLPGLDEVATEMVNGDSTSNAVNLMYVQASTDEEYMYTTLKAISMIDKGEELLINMDTELRNWMLSLALANKELNYQINKRRLSQTDRSVTKSFISNPHYSETYAMDLYEYNYTFKSLTASEMKSSKYSEENDWIIIHQASGNRRGLVARKDLGAGSVEGVGLNATRFYNGATLNREQSKELDSIIKTIPKSEQIAWLKANRFIKDGDVYRVLISKQVKVEKLGLIQNAAHSLYRTYIHNRELIQTESIRELILNQGTENITTLDQIQTLENTLKYNDRVGINGKAGKRIEVKPFVYIDYKSLELQHIKSFSDLKQSYPMIAKYFKSPERLTSFNGFNEKITLVKRSVSDVLLGHENFSLFGDSDYRSLAKTEVLFKKLVTLAKQKLVVANPIKLIKDSISNYILLNTMGVSNVDIIKGINKGLIAYKEYAKERTKYIQLVMDVTLADANYKLDKSTDNKNKVEQAKVKRDNQLEYLKTLEFHDAFNYGFIQSYSTDLVAKEHDYITGIQVDITKFIDQVTHNREGDPNRLFKAIKWWQGFGFGMDDVFKKMGELALIKNTDASTELIELAERLKRKKMDKESVANYVSDYIGAPASEVINYGSAYMVLVDALSKYTLAQHLMTQINPTPYEKNRRKLYTKEEAYKLANTVFIDYRTNIPAPIKALSDYGILLFPNFWIKMQRTLFHLLKYKPVSTGIGFGVASTLGQEALHPLKQLVFEKDITHAPGDVIDPVALVTMVGGL